MITPGLIDQESQGHANFAWSPRGSGSGIDGIWSRNHAILREKLHRVQGSRPWNHELIGELCIEYCQNLPNEDSTSYHQPHVEKQS